MTDTPDILRRIVARKHEEIAWRQARVPQETLAAGLADVEPPRGFIAALQARIDAGQAAVIAEIKKASPSKGVLREDFRPAAIARSYESGGASCLSLLESRCGNDRPGFPRGSARPPSSAWRLPAHCRSGPTCCLPAGP